jgi:hypothetical protein
VEAFEKAYQFLTQEQEMEALESARVPDEA